MNRATGDGRRRREVVTSADDFCNRSRGEASRRGFRLVDCRPMKFRPLFILAGLLVAIALPCVADTVIEGRVQLPKSHSAPVMTKRYDIVTKGGVLATDPPLAVVYVDGSFPKPATPATAQVAQKDLAFLPPLLAVQAGTKVEFPNMDDAYHNIFSYSPAKRFDLGRYRPDERPIPFQMFDTPGLITLRCDIHEHMRGLILVLNTPHFVVTEPDGHFRLTGVPPGRYDVKAWIDSRTTRQQSAEVKSGATTHVDFP
jgi:plastocyanin